MLLLTRKPMQVVKIGPDVTLVVTRIPGGQFRLDIEAPWFAQIEKDALPSNLLPQGVGSKAKKKPLGEKQESASESSDEADFLAITWRSSRGRQSDAKSNNAEG